MAQTVVVGQRIQSNCEFRLRGVRTDPLLVRCLIRHPSGTTEIFNFPSDVLSREETGLYSAQFVVEEAGNYHVRWEGSGTVDAVSETELEVSASGVIAQGEEGTN